MALAKLVVIGAGPMGLAVAYQALQDGHPVDVVDASQEPGGMAGHFAFGGISIGRLYNFVCGADTPIARLQIVDTCFYYPEDPGIAESVRLGRDMARAIRS